MSDITSTKPALEELARKCERRGLYLELTVGDLRKTNRGEDYRDLSQLRTRSRTTTKLRHSRQIVNGNIEAAARSLAA